MTKEDLIALKEKISKLSEEELKKRNLYLRGLANGTIQGPPVGYASIDRLWLKEYPEESILEECPHQTMYEMLKESISGYEDDIILVFDMGSKKNSTEISGRELLEKIDLLASNLQKKGIKPGQRVATSFANTPEAVYMLYALNKIGAIMCPIDPRANAYNIQSDLNDLQASVYVGITDTYKEFRKANNKLKNQLNEDNIYIVPAVKSLNNKVIKFVYKLSRALQGNFTIKKEQAWDHLFDYATNCNFNDISGSEDQLAVICYTGGTTGVHKGVKISNASMNNMVFSHKYLVENINRGDIFMDILPQFMIFGMFTIHLALCRGLKTHLLLDSAPEHFVDNLIRLNPAIAFGGPVHWETLIDNPKLVKDSLTNLCAPVSGGEKLSKAKEEAINVALEKAGAKEDMWIGYGASELSGSVTLKRGKRDRNGTIGKMHVYDNAMIIDPETKEELMYNQIGEFYISTPSLMMGYLNMPDEDQKAIFTDEYGTRWFRSGDLGLADTEGNIELTGRQKRLFVCGVDNVYPFILEELINTIDNVKKCAVVNIPDDVLREIPKAHIVLIEDTPEKRQKVILQIEKLVIEKISKNVIPRQYQFDEQLLYTPNGKIDFEEIRRLDLEQLKNEHQNTKIKR